jgi:hypothetical protein
MCIPVLLGAAAGALGASAIGSSALLGALAGGLGGLTAGSRKSGGIGAASPAGTPAAMPGSQAARTPDQAKARKAAEAMIGPAGGFAGNTLLTGVGGVDSAFLNLGKNNLLGA